MIRLENALNKKSSANEETDWVDKEEDQSIDDKFVQSNVKGFLQQWMICRRN